MNVLVLGCLTPATGNATTAQRIAGHLAAAHDVTLLDSGSIAGPVELDAVVRSHRIDVAVGLHALLGGALLHDAGVPFGIVFGGTDLYEPMHRLLERQMTGAASAAAGGVAFSPANLARAEAAWPAMRGRVACIRRRWPR